MPRKVQQQPLPSSKTAFTKYLISKGFTAELVDGVVMVFVDSADDVDKTMAKVRKLMDKCGYHSSFGVRGRMRREKD